MGVEVEIMGHKAKIERVSTQLGERSIDISAKDHLVVWLAFDEAVGSLLSFGILLPVKKYDREEFLYNVCRRGEEDLKQHLAKYERDTLAMQDRHERQAVLDAAAAEAQSLIE